MIHPTGLPLVRHILEIMQKTGGLGNRRKITLHIRHSRAPFLDTVDHDRLSISPACHQVVNAIALLLRNASLDEGRLIA